MGYKFHTILAGTTNEEKLTHFWQHYFSEIPKCSEPGCERLAMEVDTFFPYLDENNRCQLHLSLDKAKQMVEEGGCSKNLNHKTNVVVQRMRVKKPSLWRNPERFSRAREIRP